MGLRVLEFVFAGFMVLGRVPGLGFQAGAWQSSDLLGQFPAGIVASRSLTKSCPIRLSLKPCTTPI